MTASCRRLHTALKDVTDEAIVALSRAAVPGKLRARNNELVAALKAYRSRINLDLNAIASGNADAFRGTHESPPEGRVNLAVLATVRLAPGVYVPLIG